MYLNIEPNTLNTLYLIAFLLILLTLLLLIYFIPIIIKSFKADRQSQNKKQKIICPICNSKDFTQKDNMIVCDQCGCKYTIEEARKLLSK